MSDTVPIVGCPPPGASLTDPDPAETDKRAIRLTDRWHDEAIGVVGWSDGGWAALTMAAERPDLPRLAILALPMPEEPCPVDLEAVTAKTLLLFGAADPSTGSKHGRWWQQKLPDARLEMVPGGGHELLPQMWGRVLSFLAPRRTR